jgi:quercetin dioxygenase-like cupin family protein
MQVQVKPGPWQIPAKFEAGFAPGIRTGRNAMPLPQPISRVLFTVLACHALAGQATAQDAAPTSNQGLEAIILQAVDLENEIEGLQNRQLRLRMLTLEPGGHIAIHSHADRPAVAYVLEGTTTVTFGDGSVRRFPAGSSIAATRETTHWHRNEQAGKMTLITVDLMRSGQ